MHINMTDDTKQTTVTAGGGATPCSLQVAIVGESENSRIEIQVAHQFFTLEYYNDDRPSMEWFAQRCREALAKAGANVAENSHE